MADLRIEKTRTKLRNALAELLTEMTFEKITVSDICRKSGVTRITFYAYYTDKYALADEVFNEMYQATAIIFHQMEDTLNKKADPSVSCLHLLEAILAMQQQYRELISCLALESNSYLAYAYHSFILHKAEEASLQYVEELGPVFPAKMTADGLCSGIWSFIRTGIEEGHPSDEIGEQAEELLEIELKSQVFSAKKKRRISAKTAKTARKKPVTGPENVISDHNSALSDKNIGEGICS